MSAKLVKMSHTPLFALMLLFSFVSFVVSCYERDRKNATREGR